MFTRFRSNMRWSPTEWELNVLLNPEAIDAELEGALKQEMWLDVTLYFQRCSNRTLRKEILRNVCRRDVTDDEHCLNRHPVTKIINQCSQDELDLVCKESVKTRKWEVLRCRRLAECSERVRQWAVKQASKFADKSTIQQILPWCTDGQIDSVCEEVIRRGLWGVIVFNSTLLGKMSETCRRLLIEEAVQKAEDWEFEGILRCIPLCPDQRNAVYDLLIKRGLWHSVSTLLDKDKTVSDEDVQRFVREAVLASDGCVVLDMIIQHCSPNQVEPLFNEALEKGLWRGVSFLIERGISDEHRRRAVEEALKRCSDHNDFFPMFKHCDAEHCRDAMFLAIRHGLSVEILLEDHFKEKPLVELMYLWADCFVHLLKEECLLESGVSPFSKDDEYINILYGQQVFLDRLLSQTDLQDNHQERTANDFLDRLEAALKQACRKENIDFQFWYLLLRYFRLYFDNRGAKDSRERIDAVIWWVVLPTFASQVVNSCLQNYALQILLKKSNWKVITNVPMSHVWCEVRRDLFRAAVEQREWSVVMKLGDHNLYDDQRGWALGEALRERQMEVMVVLGDHGLTNDQLRRVHRQVAKHGAWDVFLKLLDRGVDVKQVRQELETANIGRERPPSEDAVARYKKRLDQLRDLEGKILVESRDFETAIADRNWPAVLLRVRCRKIKQVEIDTTLSAAVEAEAWHVVMLLIKLGLSVEQRSQLFSEAIRRQLWGVGRALLERQHSVSAELCEAFLPVLIEARQWVLVARVAEQDVDDALRRTILHQVIDKREGSAAAHCISILRDSLSVEEREAIFKRVLSEDQWLVVRPLVEEKDSTGADQRDRAFLAAVDRERWEDVDHCVHHGADIDMKDKEGHTLMQKAAREKCWSKVNGLVPLGANQFLLDSDGYLAIHRAADRRNHAWMQSEALRTLVEFHGDINQQDPEGYNPLQRFIKEVNTEMIECALLWGQNVGQRVMYRGKTALHVMCEHGLWDTLRYIVGRGGDPLATDLEGRTILYYACKRIFEDRQKLVAECIKLGITTYQPYINLLIRLGYISVRAQSHLLVNYGDSPFNQAFRTNSLGRDRVVITKMLYESGACSNLEIFDLYEGEPFIRYPGEVGDEACEYLTKISTNPRSLQSLCRIVISLFVGVGRFGVRQKKVERLPTLSDRMKDYVLFRDLLHPDFGK